jgi:hypothetical protein
MLAYEARFGVLLVYHVEQFETTRRAPKAHFHDHGEKVQNTEKNNAESSDLNQCSGLEFSCVQ